MLVDEDTTDTPTDDAGEDTPSSGEGASENVQTGEEEKSEEETSADDLAAAWESTLDDDSQGDIDRALSQKEIDSLLGIEGGEGSSGKSGIYKILNTDLVHYERLPMLEVVFDRLVRLLSSSIRNYTNENVDISFESTTSIRFGDYLNSIPLPAMINVFKARQWNDFGMITVDSSLIYSVVDVLLGGRKGNALMRVEGRPYTTIERRLLQKMVEVVLEDFRQSFAPLCDVNFDFDRMETNPAFAAIARPANAAVLARIRVGMEERGGRIDFLIPYATMEPIRDLLLQTFMGEKFGQDSIWEDHLENQLWSTDFTLEATIGDVSLPLNDLLNLKVGSQILLNATPDSKALIRCGDKVLFSGYLGRKGHNIAIKIEDEFIKGKMMEELL